MKQTQQSPSTNALSNAACHPMHRKGGHKPLVNPRAVVRLEIAGRLLENRGVSVCVTPDERYIDAVLRTIEAMPRESQETLKSHVDWVEELS